MQQSDKKLDSSEHEAVTEIKKSGANIFDEYSKYKHVDPSKFYDRVSSGSDVVITFKEIITTEHAYA